LSVEKVSAVWRTVWKPLEYRIGSTTLYHPFLT